MTYPRAHLVDSINGGFYHCISRCVRRAWLCGNDEVSGRSYEHRKDWVESRILHLSTCFAVDLFGYAVMSNHYHLVLELRPEQTRAWSDEEIARRWLRLSANVVDGVSEHKVTNLLGNQDRIGVLRERLGNLSWFMRYLNEHIARRANREDACTGRFWEGRFKSFALLDEAAVLASTAYVDLNPVRARLTDRVECAHYTSIARRLSQMEQCEPQLANLSRIGTDLPHYLELLRWTAIADQATTGSPSHPLSTSLKTPTHSVSEWLARVKSNRFKFRAYGATDKLHDYAQRLGQQWLKSSTRKQDKPT